MRASTQIEYIIEIRDLGKRFGFRPVLQKINLFLKRGDFLALFGPNGAGKTTLIRILCALMRPTSGKICVAGFDTRHKREAVSSVIGVISHNPFLYPDLTAFENLKFYGMMYSVCRLNERIAHLMELVGLSEFADERVMTFSRGMQQRLSVARAIIHGPEILLLDEPYTGLDQRGAEKLRQILINFRDQGKTVVMTSHDLHKGLELCNRAAILNSGKLVYDEYRVNENADNFKETYLNYTASKQPAFSISL